MARCPDCNKFVSYDESTEPEVNVDIDSEGTITGDILIVLACAECGTELKETTFAIEIESELREKHEGEGHELAVEVASAEMTSRQDVTDKKGKPIPIRYRKTYYGVLAVLHMTCSCGLSKEVSFEDEIQASALEEL